MDEEHESYIEEIATPRKWYNMVENLRWLSRDDLVEAVKVMNRTMPVWEIEQTLRDDLNISRNDTNRILKEAIGVEWTDTQRQTQTNETPLNEEESFPITNIRKIESYVPDEWEWNTKAEQLATAVNKLVYRYYNDWDRYDEDYANEVANYANWIERNAFELPEAVLTRWEYEDNLQTIVDRANELIEEWKEMPKVWSIYSNRSWKWTYED